MENTVNQLLNPGKEKPKQQETRRWDSVSEKTELMRTKEQAEDYRFIPDPDLPIIKINKQRTNQLEKQLPESPMQKLEKIIKKHKINQTDAEVLTQNLEIVELFEKIIEKIPPKLALPWITVEWLSVLNFNNCHCVNSKHSDSSHNNFSCNLFQW